MFLARQVLASMVWAPVFIVWAKWSPPRRGAGGLAGIAPAMINAERFLFGIDLLFCAAFAFSFWQTYCPRHVWADVVDMSMLLKFLERPKINCQAIIFFFLSLSLAKYINNVSIEKKIKAITVGISSCLCLKYFCSAITR